MQSGAATGGQIFFDDRPQPQIPGPVPVKGVVALLGSGSVSDIRQSGALQSAMSPLVRIDRKNSWITGNPEVMLRMDSQRR